MRRDRRRRGDAFTLLEVLLAVVLIVILMGAALALYRYAADVRRDVFREAELTSARRLIMDRITAELRTATPSPLAGFALQGSPTSILFVTTTLPSADAWAQDRPAGDTPPPEGDIQIVGYGLAVAVEGEAYEIVGLRRTLRRSVTARIVEGDDGAADDLITDRLRFLRLRYWDGVAWVDGWTGEELPAAVEITLGERPLPEGVEPADYPFRAWRRIVALHAARSAPPDRGLPMTGDRVNAGPAEPRHVALQPRLQRS